ncbi:hypothetical protein IPA_02990 [Ignicoccus pacificus DSM 13166]|uniref:Uncharacterized protein n=1 Tax=Ignicoccus pacificus DSM 13166 TaxID=940294 RepID=A0A977PL92_9CREN|nr:hypothetical protein IPA_02990 [Ignicoccus pacificus DSM 13166]
MYIDGKELYLMWVRFSKDLFQKESEIEKLIKILFNNDQNNSVFKRVEVRQNDPELNQIYQRKNEIIEYIRTVHIPNQQSNTDPIFLIPGRNRVRDRIYTFTFLKEGNNVKILSKGIVSGSVRWERSNCVIPPISIGYSGPHVSLVRTASRGIFRNWNKIKDLIDKDESSIVDFCKNVLKSKGEDFCIKELKSGEMLESTFGYGFVLDDQTTVPLWSMGDGFRGGAVQLSILDALSTSHKILGSPNKKLFVLDTPEAFMHPELEEYLASQIAYEASRTEDLYVATATQSMEYFILLLSNFFTSYGINVGDEDKARESISVLLFGRPGTHHGEDIEVNITELEITKKQIEMDSPIKNVSKHFTILEYLNLGIDIRFLKY